MRRSFNPGKEPSFQKILIFSFILNLGFIALTAIPPVHKKKEIKNYYVSLVNPAVVRRDVVSKVPGKTTVAETKVVEKTKKIETVKDIKEIKKVKMSMEPTLTLRQRIDKKIKEKQEEDKKLKPRDIAVDNKGRVNKTAEVAPEASNIYEGMKSSDAYLLYVDLIRQRIEFKPVNVGVEDLLVTIEIKFTKDWKIDKYIPIKLSDSKSYNTKALEALRKAMASSMISPFPAPPPGYEQEALDGIIISLYPPE